MNKRDIIKKIASGTLQESDLISGVYVVAKNGNGYINQSTKELISEHQFIQLTKGAGAVVFLSIESLEESEVTEILKTTERSENAE